MKTVYENLKEMLDLAVECRKAAEDAGDEAKIAFWEIKIIEAHAELTKYAR